METKATVKKLHLSSPDLRHPEKETAHSLTVPLRKSKFMEESDQEHWKVRLVMEMMEFRNLEEHS